MIEQSIIKFFFRRSPVDDSQLQMRQRVEGEWSWTDLPTEPFQYAGTYYHDANYEVTHNNILKVLSDV